MATNLSDSGSQGLARPSVSAVDDLGYIYFSREPTIAKLHENLHVDQAQLIHL